MRVWKFTVFAVLLAGTALSTPSFAQSRYSGPAYTVSQTAIPGAEPDGMPVQRQRYASGRNGLGGGLIEYLFTGDDNAPRRGRAIYGREYAPGGDAYSRDPVQPVGLPSYAHGEPAHVVVREQRPLDPKYEKQIVEYSGKEKAGTIVIDTPNRFLYLVQGNGHALRYGIGVGRPGFSWAGVKTVSAKREWPDWRPPAEMLARRPDLPRFMKGGPDNPLGARALYLGSSLYRIHGSNEPWTIGTAVSSGCIRMRNEDVIDLYGRVSVGAKVVVI
jgi:lipoprotein-anchoring transpeptidase ErfK/SrfK